MPRRTRNKSHTIRPREPRADSVKKIECDLPSHWIAQAMRLVLTQPALAAQFAWERTAREMIAV